MTNIKKKIKVNQDFNIIDFSKTLLLNLLDLNWKEHLVNLDFLKSGIHLRGYAQKDPKLEYKNESFLLFDEMLNKIKIEFISCFFKISSENIIFNSITENKDINMTKSNSLIYNKDPNQTKKTPFTKTENKIGRNESCYCKSGKKYKHCHGKN